MVKSLSTCNASISKTMNFYEYLILYIFESLALQFTFLY